MGVIFCRVFYDILCSPYLSPFYLPMSKNYLYSAFHMVLLLNQSLFEEELAGYKVVNILNLVDCDVVNVNAWA